MFDSLSLEQRTELRDFLIDAYPNDDELVVILASAGFEIVRHGLWNDNDIPNKKYFDLIASAEKEGWLWFLIHVVLAGKLHKAANFSRHLPKTQLAALQLTHQLEDLTLAEITQCFGAVRAENLTLPAMPPDAQRNCRAYFTFAVAVAQETSDGINALHYFSCELARRVSEARRQDLDKWWQTAAKDCELNGASPSMCVGLAAAGGAAHYPVLIELKGAEGASANPKWWPRAWLFDPARGTYDSLLDRKSQESPRDLQSLSEDLQIICKRAGERSDPTKIVLEFFVSDESFCHALDQCQISLTKFVKRAVGRVHPVIVRFQYEDALLKKSLENRYQQLLSAAVPLADSANEAQPFSPAVKLSNPGGDIDSICAEFEKTPNLQCLVVRTPVSDCQAIDAVACLPAAIVAGLPIIIWARKEHANSEYLAAVTRLLSVPTKELGHKLPKNVLELRQSAEPLGTSLCVFFQNGSYFLPPTQKFQAPQS